MITFNDKLEVTDHDLRQHIESCDLISTLPNTAFAQGFQSALTEVKKFLKSNVMLSLPSDGEIASKAHKERGCSSMSYVQGFQDGGEWVRDKVKRGNGA